MKKILNKYSPDDFGRVAVLMGGNSAEREVSFMTGKNILNALQNAGVDAFDIDIHGSIIDCLNSATFDCVFIALHGKQGEDGVIQAVLESMKIPYTGSGVLASALMMDKHRSKLLWRGMDLPTLPFLIVNETTQVAEIMEVVGFPFVVKPTDQGSSIGVTIVRDTKDYVNAYQHAAKYSASVMVETYGSGGDYTVPILSDMPMPSIKIETPRDFYDYDAKYFVETTRYLCPSGLSAQREQQLHDLAMEAFKIMGGVNWGRADFICDEQGEFYLMDMNSIPGMTEHSLVPMAAKAKGIDFQECVLRVLVDTL